MAAFKSMSQTNVGMFREINEDSYLDRADLGLFVIADGMGGHAAGEVASKKTVEVLEKEFETQIETLITNVQANTSQTNELVLTQLYQMVQNACKEVFYHAQQNRACQGMGSTTSLLWLHDTIGFIAHVGDSRVYLIRSGELHQLTEDHTYVNEQIKKGIMTPEEAKRSPYANVITRAMGVTESVEVDTFYFEILPGDKFLLCSDGLYNYFRNKEEIVELVSLEQDEEVATKAISLANARGGKDNISVIIVKVSGDTVDEITKHFEHRLNIIKEVIIFKNLTYKEMMLLLSMAEVKKYQKDELIANEGEKGEDFGIILKGKVDIIKKNQLLVSLSKGQQFGEMSLIDHSPRSASVVAADECEVMSISRKNFYSLIRKEPELSTKLLWGLLQVLSVRLRAANDALTQV